MKMNLRKLFSNFTKKDHLLLGIDAIITQRWEQENKAINPRNDELWLKFDPFLHVYWAFVKWIIIRRRSKIEALAFYPRVKNLNWKCQFNLTIVIYDWFISAKT